jgi:hypothetical protein
MFILTVVVAYGVGSWILLGYTKQAISGLGAKSHSTLIWVVINTLEATIQTVNRLQ